MTFACAPASSDAEIEACFDVLVQLRPVLRRPEWLMRARRMEREGYRLAVASDARGLAAVAGYRVFDSIARGGPSLYVDDLVVDTGRRSEGAGAALIAWLCGEARRSGCLELCLDSGIQRRDAHRFYLRERMIITAHHFTLKLAPEA